MRLGAVFLGMVAPEEAASAPRVARVYDYVDDAAEPGFATDHPRLDPAEARRVVGYLRSGAMVMTTTERRPDVLDPAAGAVVPLSFRTDGHWVWSEATTYFAERHALAPEPELLDAARAAGYQVGDGRTGGGHPAGVSSRGPSRRTTARRREDAAKSQP
jgi:hypothetical protein